MMIQLKFYLWQGIVSALVGALAYYMGRTELVALGMLATLLTFVLQNKLRER
ncbi:MAG: hypothetical protein P4L87_24110 [Formivibrio sp.]|nr:hypothetical protein [Formivibrio sp.]